jgi:hypothetical protein
LILFFTLIKSFALANLSEQRSSMRADYATSDLINKVNSDWIDAVLANPELDRADPGGDDDAHDLTLRPQSFQKQTFPRRRERARPPGNPAKVDYPEPGITVEPNTRPSRRRSVARRVTERLALAVAALAVVGVGAWTVPLSQDVTNAVSERATNASPEPASSINTTELRPAWLSPEILYGPAMARSPLSVPTSGR